MKERTVKDWHNHCLLPDGTELQEHSIKTNRNIVIGEFCRIEYGQGIDVLVGESSKIREQSGQRRYQSATGPRSAAT